MPAYKPGVVYDLIFNNVFDRLSHTRSSSSNNNYRNVRDKSCSKDADVTFSLENSNDL